MSINDSRDLPAPLIETPCLCDCSEVHDERPVCSAVATVMVPMMLGPDVPMCQPCSELW